MIFLLLSWNKIQQRTKKDNTKIIRDYRKQENLFLYYFQVYEFLPYFTERGQARTFQLLWFIIITTAFYTTPLWGCLENTPEAILNNHLEFRHGRIMAINDT